MLMKAVDVQLNIYGSLQPSFGTHALVASPKIQLVNVL